MSNRLLQMTESGIFQFNPIVQSVRYFCVRNRLFVKQLSLAEKINTNDFRLSWLPFFSTGSAVARKRVEVRFSLFPVSSERVVGILGRLTENRIFANVSRSQKYQLFFFPEPPLLHYSISYYRQYLELRMFSLPRYC